MCKKNNTEQQARFGQTPRTPITRRNFVKFSAGVLFAGSCCGYEYDQLTHLEITRYTFPIRQIIGRPIRIVHLSDIHNSYFLYKQADKTVSSKIVNMLSAYCVDLIAISGDLIDKRHPHINDALQFLELLSKVAPVYYVTGNHENQLLKSHFDLMNEFFSKARSFGINLLRQDYITSVSDLPIKIFGVDDPLYSDNNHWKEQINQLSHQCTSTTFNILISHRPEYWELYKGFDLSLCGHTHGGQIRLPLIGPLWAPNQGFFPPYSAGLYRDNLRVQDTELHDSNSSLSCMHHCLDQTENKDIKTNHNFLLDSQRCSRMVVSRGIGCSVIPLRTQNRPEIIIIELCSQR